jgi:hypothetical protein
LRRSHKSCASRAAIADHAGKCRGLFRREFAQSQSTRDTNVTSNSKDLC